MALWRDSGAFCGAAWFAPFGFASVLREPERADESMTPEELLETNLILVGTADSVSRQIERLLETTPMRWLFAWTYNGLVPHAKLMRSLELFATKVLPRFRRQPGLDSLADQQDDEPASLLRGPPGERALPATGTRFLSSRAQWLPNLEPSVAGSAGLS